MNKVQTIVLEALTASGWPSDELKADESLLDLGFDSLALALLVSEIERQCKIRVNVVDISIADWNSVSSIANKIEPYLKDSK